jgi:hypothetical protein
MTNCFGHVFKIEQGLNTLIIDSLLFNKHKRVTLRLARTSKVNYRKYSYLMGFGNFEAD